MFVSFLWQVENLQQENVSLRKQVQKVKEQFLQQKVSKSKLFQRNENINYVLQCKYVFLRATVRRLEFIFCIKYKELCVIVTWFQLNFYLQLRKSGSINHFKLSLVLRKFAN